MGEIRGTRGRQVIVISTPEVQHRSPQQDKESCEFSR